MKKLLLALFVCLFCWSWPARAATDVWLMYGLGDNAFGSSSGIDVIAARARQIPGVTSVQVRNYWDTTTIFNELMSKPADHRIVVGGYSCGVNSATVVARAAWQHGHRTVNTVVGIQQSLWCGGDDLESNVNYGQSTYNADCAQTFGLGCKPLAPAPSFQGRILNINRPDSHGAADNDPDAQNDVLRAIALTARGARPPRPPPCRDCVAGLPLPPSPPPQRPGLDCRWAWTSERGWAVLCTRPPANRHAVTIVRYRSQRAY